MKVQRDDKEAVVQRFRSQRSSIYVFVLSTPMQNKLRKKKQYLCCLCFRVRIIGLGNMVFNFGEEVAEYDYQAKVSGLGNRL